MEKKTKKQLKYELDWIYNEKIEKYPELPKKYIGICLMNWYDAQNTLRRNEYLKYLSAREEFELNYTKYFPGDKIDRDIILNNSGPNLKLPLYIPADILDEVADED